MITAPRPVSETVKALVRQAIDLVYEDDGDTQRAYDLVYYSTGSPAMARNAVVVAWAAFMTYQRPAA